MKYCSKLALSCLIGLGLALTSYAADASAPEAPKAPAPEAPTPALPQPTVAAPEDTNEDVVTLDVFNVSSTRDTGWLATESTSGTRMAMPIVDMPYAMDVMTSDFIEEFGLYDVVEQAMFLSEAAGGDSLAGTGGFTIRGFGAPYFRNGFQRTQQPEGAGTERTEILKGPQSALYGRAAPGGIVNFISKKPKEKFQSKLSYMLGSYSKERVEGYVTGPLVKNKLYYRLGGFYSYKEGETDFWYERVRAISAGLLWKIGRNTSLSLEFDHSLKSMNAQSATIQWMSYNHNEGIWYLQGPIWSYGNKTLANRIMRTNQRGSNSLTDRRNDSYYATFEHRITPTVAMRISAGYSNRSLRSNRSSTSAFWLPPEELANVPNHPTTAGLKNRDKYITASTNSGWEYGINDIGFWSAFSMTTNTSHAYYGDPYRNGPTGPAGRTTIYREHIDYSERGLQVDLVKTWPGTLKQRTLFILDGNLNDQWNKRYRWTSTDMWNQINALDIANGGTGGYAANNAKGYAWQYIDPFKPNVTGYYPTPYGGPIDTGGWSTTLKQYYGAALSHSINLLNNRMLIVGSLRYDKGRYKYRGTGRVTGPMTAGGKDKTTYSIGVNYKIKGEEVVSYVSYGTSFNPAVTIDSVTNKNVGNPFTKGLDAGLKGVLGNFSYVLSFYEIYQDNNPQTNPDYRDDPLTAESQYLNNGRKKGRGGALLVTGKLTDLLNIRADFSVSKTWWDKTGDAEEERWYLGKIVDGAGPQKKGSVTLSYRIGEHFGLRRLSFSTQFAYGEGYLRTRANYDQATNPIARRIDLYSPGYTRWNFRLNYGWKVGKVDLTCQLAMLNAFDQVRPSSSLGFVELGRSYEFTIRATF